MLSDEYESFRAVRRVEYRRGERRVTLAPGAVLRLARSDPTVDRAEIAELVGAGALRPCGSFRRVSRGAFSW